MENKYELKEKEIETLKGQVEKLRELTLKEDEEIRNLIKEQIQVLTPNKLWFGIDSRRRYDDYWRVEIGFINEKGETDFGSTFTLYVYTKDTTCYKEGIYVSTGTIGQWSVDTHPYQYSRIILINQILEHRASLLMFFKDLVNKQTIAPIFEKLRSELGQAEWELKHDIRIDKEHAIEAKLIVGSEIQLGDNFFIKISKVTPKRVYYARGLRNYNYETNQYEDKISYYNFDGEIKNKKDLINSIYYAEERNDKYVKFLN